MAAPDQQTIYSFENAIEGAIDTLLEAEGLTSSRQRDTGNLATPFSGVQLQVGSQNDEHGTILPNATEFRRGSYNGTVAIRVATNRTNNTSSHSSYLGKVRKVMHGWQTNFTTSNLPYVAIYEVIEQGTTHATNDEEDHDISEITFAIKWRILDSAWPT